MDPRNLARQLAIALVLFGVWIAFTGFLALYWNVTSGLWPPELYIPGIANLCVGIVLSGVGLIYLRNESSAETR